MPARLRAALAYCALSVPFGIAVHIGSEFAGLGRDADDLAFSPLHAYLAVLAIVSIVGFCRWSRIFTGGPAVRRRIALMADALPFHGHGPKFFLFSAALQFGFFVTTQLGEGCPMCRGDAIVGVIAALVASVIGAFALIALRKEIVRAIVLAGSARDRCPRSVVERRAHSIAYRPIPTYSTFAVVLGNRPPPLFS
jgi:hypothetical protein